MVPFCVRIEEKVERRNLQLLNCLTNSKKIKNQKGKLLANSHQLWS